MVPLIEVREGFPDTISFWIEAYFRFEVTTSKSSQKVQTRDLSLFRDFLIDEAGSEERRFWTPRQSKAFKDYLKKKDLGKGKQGYSDRTINRIMAHLKTFAKWIHKLKPFPLDNPMAKLKLLLVGTGLERVKMQNAVYVCAMIYVVLYKAISRIRLIPAYSAALPAPRRIRPGAALCFQQSSHRL
jgi:integrase